MNIREDINPHRPPMQTYMRTQNWSRFIRIVAIEKLLADYLRTIAYVEAKTEYHPSTIADFARMNQLYKCVIYRKQAGVKNIMAQLVVG